MPTSIEIETVTREFFDAINGGDLEEVLNHFSDDGVVYHPFGEFSGKSRLHEFYGGIVLPAKVKLEIGRVVADESASAAELIGTSPLSPDKPQYALDLIEFSEDKKIQRLSVYYLNALT